MKIFFTVAYNGKAKYQKHYDMILNALNNTPNIDLISPEILPEGSYKKVLSIKEKSQLKTDEEIHYRAIQKGIELADLVIIDITHECFQLGHEATVAMNNKKPVLVLSRKKDISKQILNPYLYGAKYNKFNIEYIIENFIDSHRDQLLSQRFNMLLSQRQLRLLEDKAKALGISKSEVVRKFLEG
jgi:hypothetical protein